MAYSSIKPKTGLCVDCNDGIMKVVVKKGHNLRCHYHHKRSKISTVEEIPNPDDKQKENWFRARVMEMAGKCMECGQSTNRHIYKYAICSVAHILPKSTFPSVAYHPLNWLELGAQCGCHSKAEVFSNAVKMKIWPEMVRRFLIIYPSIAIEERRRIPEVLLSTLKTDIKCIQ